MTKKTLKEYCNEIDIWDGWLNSYRKYVPNFIEEAKTKVSWQEWDKDIFFEFFERSNDQCVSSLRQGYFTKEEQEKIKSNWSEISKLLKTIAENQETPNWNTYQELKKKIRQNTSQDRKAATNRLVASLQPKLISTIVSEGDLGELINKINTYTTSSISSEGDWFKRSYNICKLFQQELEP
jgi:5-methylcytosine-specific restriction protein B